MLDKCAVAGDITQGIDRRGVWTAAITVIGGTSNTAVKLVSCDTVDGEYTDFKTLISASDAETDQYKGFVVDLHGAKKYIKVTGATMATAVFGDCDHDVKDIAITAGEVPSGADLENNKAATIDASTYTSPVEVTPSEGKDGMKKATITLSNIPSGGTPELKSFKYNETAGGVNIGDTLSLLLFEGQDNIALSSDKSTWFGGGFTTIPLTSLLNGETVDVSIKTGPGAITITLSYDGNVNGIVTGTVKAKATDYYGTKWYLGAYQIVSV